MKHHVLAVALLVPACGGSSPPPAQPAAVEARSGPAEAAPAEAAPAEGAPAEDEGAFASLTGSGELAGGDGQQGGGGTSTGVIGHGSGTGDGTGTGPSPAAAPPGPTVDIGEPAATGELDKAIIRRYIKRNLLKLRYCYEKQLVAKKPDLAGRVEVKFTIGREGTVTAASATGLDPDVDGCVADVIRAIHFPKPRGGGEVHVTYPFVFAKQ